MTPTKEFLIGEGKIAYKVQDKDVLFSTTDLKKSYEIEFQGADTVTISKKKYINLGNVTFIEAEVEEVDAPDEE